MKQSTLILLVAVTAVVVAAAFFSLRARDGVSAGGSEAEVLLPDLAASVNDAHKVVIAKAGSTATLERRDDGWVCVEASGYPADAEKAVKTLRTLTQLALVERMTASPEKHAELGLDLESGARVTIEDGSGQTLCDVVIGETRYSRSGQRVYARLADQDQTWLCEGDLALSGDPSTWIDRELVRVDSARPQRVEIVHSDGERLVASRGYPAQPNWEVQDVPEGRALSTPGIANSLGTALSYLNFDEVKRAEDLELGTHHVATTTVSAFDGASYEVRLATIDGQHWITLDASYEAPAEPAGPPANGGEDEGEDAADPTAPPPAPDAERREELRKETAELDERLEGWAFRIPEYKAEVFSKRMEDLLAPLDEPEDAPADPASDLLPEEPAAGAAEADAPVAGDAAPAEPDDAQQPADAEPTEDAAGAGETGDPAADEAAGTEDGESADDPAGEAPADAPSEDAGEAPEHPAGG